MTEWEDAAASALSDGRDFVFMETTSASCERLNYRLRVLAHEIMQLRPLRDLKVWRSERQNG
jgi:hypothetical protein